MSTRSKRKNYSISCVSTEHVYGCVSERSKDNDASKLNFISENANEQLYVCEWRESCLENKIIKNKDRKLMDCCAVTKDEWKWNNEKFFYFHCVVAFQIKIYQRIGRSTSENHAYISVSCREK